MRPEEIMIRPYSEADRGAVLELAGRLTIGMPDWRDADACLAAVREWVTLSMSRDPESGALFVASDSTGTVLGFLSVELAAHFSGKQEAYIGELVVSESAEGAGIGRRLVRQAEDWARQRGLPTLTLVTGAANQPARRFYQRVGFLEEEVRLTKLLDAS